MVTRYFLIAWVVLVISACTVPKQPVATEKYHETQEIETKEKSLNGYQKQAIKLMNQQQYNDSISFLQRAIKVEPRNPLNWHYLAQNYWHLKDFSNCRAMVQRAQSYIQYQPDLGTANQTLMQQCSQ